MDEQGGAHGRQGAALRVGRAVRAPAARTWASASHRAFTLQATGVAMANATYEFMRANATEEMRRVLGAKAANVQLAVPPTLAAGDWSVDSEGDGEGSSGDLHDGVSESDNNN